MNKERPVRLFADPSFCRMLKAKAASKGLTLVKFTAQAAREPNLLKELEEDVKENKKKRGGWDSIF